MKGIGLLGSVKIEKKVSFLARHFELAKVVVQVDLTIGRHWFIW